MISPNTVANRPVGHLLREWRQHRRLSQMDLALEAEISTRHLSFVETGRSHPSREMLLHLAEQLDVPLRERNLLLSAAGYAPVFPQRSLDDPALQSARKAVELVLHGHSPYPALAVDRHWNLIAANASVAPLLAGVSPALREAPTNVLRLALHPEGLASRTVNYGEWRAHLLERLGRQVAVTADPVLRDLLEELRNYPAPAQADMPSTVSDYAGVAVPFQLAVAGGQVLSFFSTTTIFGTPVDVTLSELALESFFPADAETAIAMRGLAESGAQAAN